MPLYFSTFSNFYREEFLKCQRCLDEQREYYSERTICEVEQALTRVMSQLDQLCAQADAERLSADSCGNSTSSPGCQPGPILDTFTEIRFLLFATI